MVYNYFILMDIITYLTRHILTISQLFYIIKSFFLGSSNINFYMYTNYRHVTAFNNKLTYAVLLNLYYIPYIV